MGDSSKAIQEGRVAVDLDPLNHLYLTDLGWTLVEAGQYSEAGIVLKKAVDLSPPGYDLAKNNLEELRRLRTE
ncbi:MAG: hypothetical protein JRH06_10085 [Deltaproteobacteria bacterium]|nr:hypothetical protein [Deltaproteobacteria bacterium]